MSQAFEQKNIVVTGATGGIGFEIVKRLKSQGANMFLVSHDPIALASSLSELGLSHDKGIGVDFLQPESINQVITTANQVFDNHIDTLVNCAGMLSFAPFEQTDPDLLQAILQVNLMTPMRLMHGLLPQMKAAGQGHFVNVGSTFGSIGFGFFAAYSASKFGLRGLSEALRRELEGTGVKVTYVAPRAVKTPLNSDKVYTFAKKTKMNMDEPTWVAEQVVSAMQQNKKDVYLGFPEKLFARLNGFLPRLVDSRLRDQMKQARELLKG